VRTVQAGPQTISEAHFNAAPAARLYVYPSQRAFFSQLPSRAAPPVSTPDFPPGAVAEEVFSELFAQSPPEQILLPDGMLHWRDYALVASVPPVQFSCAGCGEKLHWARYWSGDDIQEGKDAQYPNPNTYALRRLCGIDYYLTDPELPGGIPTADIVAGCCGYSGRVGGAPNWLCAACKVPIAVMNTDCVGLYCTALLVSAVRVSRLPTWPLPSNSSMLRLHMRLLCAEDDVASMDAADLAQQSKPVMPRPAHWMSRHPPVLSRPGVAVAMRCRLYSLLNQLTRPTAAELRELAQKEEV
jgi:hypothetical protein